MATKPPVSRTAEFQAGRAAFDDGVDATDNPHSPDTVEAQEWRSGWISRSYGLFPSEEIVRP